MEVLMGPTFGIETAYVRGRSSVQAQDKNVPAAALFMAEESGHEGTQIGSASQIGMREGFVDSPVESSESSSSIGAPGESSENEEEEDDAVSSHGSLSSLTTLQDSLPIKRGLSNHFMGKSKSFGNLMEANSVKDLEKVENPFNKKRRLLIANKLRRRTSRSSSSHQFYAWKNPNSMPLLALQESDNEDHEEEDEDSGDYDDDRAKLLQEKKKNNNTDLMVQTQSCFCLSSLQEEEEDQ